MQKRRILKQLAVRSERSNHLKRLLKRALALVMCVAMAASIITFSTPVQADEPDAPTDTLSGNFENLYIRQADDNTMDSYVLASLGGYTYNSKDLDGTTGASTVVDPDEGPWVINNYGTRYAGEVWADKSVFARYREVDAVTDDDVEKGYKNTTDGDFNGRNLQLGRYTDGIDAVISMDDYADFLEVFSVLGSTEIINDSASAALDVVFVLDASGSMNDGDLRQYITGTEWYDDLDKGGKHENINSRLEFAADALNSAFKTLMDANDYNRVALVTYNDNINVQQVLSLGRYEPTKVVRTAWQSEGYRNSTSDDDLRYFTVAKDGYAWPASAYGSDGDGGNKGYGVISYENIEGSDKQLAYIMVMSKEGESYKKYIGITGTSSDGTPGIIGDDRFSGVETFNQLRIKAGQTGSNWPDGYYDENKGKYDATSVANEWGLIEVNAQPEGAEEGTLTEWAGEYVSKKVVPTSDKNAVRVVNNGKLTGQRQYQFINTYSNTETQLGIIEAMQNILATEDDKTVTVYRDKDGNVYDEIPVGGSKDDYEEVELERRPIVILLTDGRPNMVRATTDGAWWYRDAGRTTGQSGTNSEIWYGNTALYTAASAALWKELVNINYYGDPTGKETEDGNKLETQFYTFGLCLDDDVEMNSEIWTDKSKINQVTEDIKDLSEDDQKKRIKERQDAYDLATAYIAYLIYVNSDNYNQNDASISNLKAVLTSQNLTALLDDFNTSLSNLELNDDSSFSAFTAKLGSLLATNPYANPSTIDKATIELSTGWKFNLGTGVLTTNDPQQYPLPAYDENSTNTLTFTSGEYQPSAVSDFNFANRFKNVDNPNELPDILETVVNSIITGESFTVFEGTNSAGVEDALVYSDPIGDYMTLDSVTDITLFGRHYKVEKDQDYEYKSGVDYTAYYNSLPSYITAMEINKTEDKVKNTIYTVYKITKDVTDDDDGKKINPNNHSAPKDGEPQTDWTSTVRVNESYGTTFDLLKDINIWVEDTGEWRDTDDSDFIVNNGYSEALFISIGLDALPTQVANVTLRVDGTPLRYVTNLVDFKATTPLRVFYNVSMEKDYLRYLADKENVKANAVGVALAKVTPEYLEENTAYYKDGSSVYWDTNTGSFIAYTADSAGAGKKVAFYSNYFTDSSYDEYPVASDPNKTSRGNSTVTFSPGTDNQFYRFQKNRVLFMIPGAYDSNLDDPIDRPAEIDIGDLSNVYYTVTQSKGFTEYTLYTYSEDEDEKQYLTKLTNFTSDELAKVKKGNVIKLAVGDEAVKNAHKVDPTYYEDLCAVLNAYRQDMDGEGAKSTYWAFGDCLPVNGSEDDSTLKESEYAARLKTLDASAYNAATALRNTLNANLASAGKKYQPQISSDNWYYIIREFYYPTSFNADGTAKDSEVHYMAIPRKGSEFGSGLSNGGGMGQYIEWYNVEDGRTGKFTENASHYGIPEDNITWEEKDPSGNVIGHTHSGDWYVSAKPGGLRVGGMANFAGVKNYDIREGVDKGEFTKDEKRIALSNVTETAKTYFLPALSSYRVETDQGDEGDDEEGFIFTINTYLGNNGRILVDDSTLMVTKTVNTVAGLDAGATDTLSNPFEIEVEIEGFYGERRAVIMTRDEFNSSLWRRRFENIDVLTDNQRLLLADDNKRIMVDRGGNRIVQDANGAYRQAVKQNDGTFAPTGTKTYTSSEVYYVYVGSNLRTGYYDDKTLRVFEANVKYNENGEFIDSAGNIYGNLSMRGGRTYYLTLEQYEKLDIGVKANANIEWDPSLETARVLDPTLYEELNETAKAFVFHIIDEGRSTYEAGDREFWINKVCLIPIDDVNQNGWKSKFTDHEFEYLNWSDGFGIDDCDPRDWRVGYTKDEETGPGGYTMIPNFNVAHLRSSDSEGNTSATELASNRGVRFTSSFLTTPVNFTECSAHPGYGVATIWLADGQGRGFNNIDNDSHYTVKEIISPDQEGANINFQQVDHVQGDGLRTRYLYNENESGNFQWNQVNDIRQTNSHAYWNDLGKHVTIFTSYRVSGTGRTVYWRDGAWEAGTIDVTANFGTKNEYTVVGKVSNYEEGVHYVNLLPDIKKLEFTPGTGTKLTYDKGIIVYPGDYITYGIRWENFSYSTATGEATEAVMTISDTLDPGLEFVAAFFNPYNSNVMDMEDGRTFNENIFLDRFGKQLQEGDGSRDWLVAAEQEWVTGAEGDYTNDVITIDAASPANGRNYSGSTKLETLNDKNMTVNVSYDAVNHKVTWTLNNAPANAFGYVELILKVKDDAWKWWDYDDPDDPDNPPVDNKVVNRSTVIVNDIERETNTVENPTGQPEKIEDYPGAGMQVRVGSKVDYTVKWPNKSTSAGTVTIQDRLDPGVDFFSASFGNIIIEPDREDPDDPNSEYKKDSNGAYSWTVSGGDADGTAYTRNSVTDGDADGFAYSPDSVPDGDADTVYSDYPAPDGDGGNLHLLGQIVGTLGELITGNEQRTGSVSDSDAGKAVNGFAGLIAGIINEEQDIEAQDDSQPVEAGQITRGYIDDDILWRTGKVYLTADEDELTDVIISYDPKTHTITWELHNVPAYYQGEVKLSVIVNENAIYEWDYDEDNWEPEENGKDLDDEGKSLKKDDDPDERIVNQARLKIGDNASWDYTEEIENPLKPKKTEPKPGEGLQVQVGDTITYYITWLNDANDTASVIITDELDPGVEYVEAGFLELIPGTNDYKELEQNPDGCSVAYPNNLDPAHPEHTVIWTLEDREPDACGMVYLKVKVTGRAVENWDYEDTDGTIREGEGDDWRVVNKAGITIANDTTQRTQFTNEVENPVEPVPEKTETDPGNGVQVRVGDTITYKITWRNYTYDDEGNAVPANVTVTDVLDPGVDFVEAWIQDNNGVKTVYLKENGITHQDGPSQDGTDGSSSDVCTVRRNTSSGKTTVTWTLPDRAPQTEGYVYLTVRVNRHAFDNWNYTDTNNPGNIVKGDGAEEIPQVVNKAGVKVGDHPEQFTEIMHNPVEREDEEDPDKPVKDEITPGADKRVSIGDEITYTITWMNDAYDEEIGLYVSSTVTVIDVLDPGVDFVKAGFISKSGEYMDSLPNAAAIYDKASHTVTWTLNYREARDSGVVYLTVKVNENAQKDYHYNQDDGNIVAGDGDDYQVVNKAAVIVDNGSTQYTNVVRNPISEEPENPDNPDKPDEPGVPKTGDDSNLGLWLILLALSMIGLGAIVFYSVRKNRLYGPKDRKVK